MKKLFVTLPSTLWTDWNQWAFSKIREIAIRSTIDSFIFTWTLRSSKYQDLPDHISPTFKLEYLLNGYSYQWVPIIFWKFIFHLPLVSCKNLHYGNLMKKTDPKIDFQRWALSGQSPAFLRFFKKCLTLRGAVIFNHPTYTKLMGICRKIISISVIWYRLVPCVITGLITNSSGKVGHLWSTPKSSFLSMW